MTDPEQLSRRDTLRHPQDQDWQLIVLAD